MLVFLIPGKGTAQISTFDDLPLDSANAYYNGADTAGGFQSGSAYFFNKYNTAWSSWKGFAYSNVKDTTTAGYTNQYSAITGAGVFNSDKYAVSYAATPSSLKLKGVLKDGAVIKGMYVTNSTYATLSMENGDSYAKKFGGSTGNDPDWFLLTVKGYFNGVYTDSVNFYLADYRFTDNTKDYIVKTWKWVDLSSMGKVDSVTFVLSSSDVGQYGMNTPAYFCMDNFNDTVYSHTGISTFDDLSLDPVDAYWNGSDLSGGFQSGMAYFFNTYNQKWGSWKGFAYSNMKDTTTAGYTNQYSAITGIGVNGSANYGVSYAGSGASVALRGNLRGGVVKGVFITNSTYAYLSMKNGDSFAKKFGGSTGNDPDWFLLTIKGFYSGTITDSVNFYLADFRFTDNSKDFILNSWAWVDLTTLGNVDSLTFNLSSSDVGQYGMNTPAYFCLDNLNDITNAVDSYHSTNEKENITAYPNPVISTLNINGAKGAYVSIVDLTGRILYRNISKQDVMHVNMSAYSNGLYLIKIRKGNHISVKKILKK